MSLPLAVVPADAFVYLAIGRMSRLKIRHLGVTDESGEIIGALSAATCCGCARAKRSRSATRSIRRGTCTISARPGRSCRRSRRRCWPRTCRRANVAAVISRRLGALTRQAAFVAETRMRKDGPGRAAMPVCARRAGFGRARRKPARHGSGQCADFRGRRAGRRRPINGSRHSASTSPTFWTKSACHIARAA